MPAMQPNIENNTEFSQNTFILYSQNEKKSRGDIMSVPVFIAYMDYCRMHHKEPNLHELHQWKKLYNHR